MLFSFAEGRIAKKRAMCVKVAARKIEVLNMLLAKHFTGITLNLEKSFDYNRLYYDIDLQHLSKCQFLRYDVNLDYYDYSKRVQVYFLGKHWSVQEDGVMLNEDNAGCLEVLWVVSYRVLQLHVDALVAEFKTICQAENLNMTSGLFNVFDIVQSLTERTTVPNVSFVLR